MAKLRSINTEFWADEYIGELSRDEKLLFLYFLTNPLTRISGAYKISRRVIKIDTGFADAELDLILARFGKDEKVIYRDGWVMLPNFLKNQSLNLNMRKNAIAEVMDAPAWVQAKFVETIRNSARLAADFETLSTLFETLSTVWEPLNAETLSNSVETLSTAFETLSTKSTNRIGIGIEREKEGEEEAPGIQAVSGELAVSETESAFKITLDRDTKLLIAKAVPKPVIAFWPAFIRGRAVGHTSKPQEAKLRQIGFALTDFQRDHKKIYEQQKPDERLPTLAEKRAEHEAHKHERIEPPSEPFLSGVHIAEPNNSPIG